MNKYTNYVLEAEDLWSAYRNLNAHLVSDTVSKTKYCEVHNFYEFAKGYSFASEIQQAKIDKQQKIIELLKKSNEEMAESIKASCEYDDTWMLDHLSLLIEKSSPEYQRYISLDGALKLAREISDQVRELEE